MKWSELKTRIGDNAKDIIISGKGLQVVKEGWMTCPITDHKKGATSVVWISNRDAFKFYCHDCESHYDISDYVKEIHVNSIDQVKQMHEWAGVPFTEKQPKIKKLDIQIEKVITDPAVDWLKSRAISDETIKTYKIASDNQYVFFRYASVVNGKMEMVHVKKRKIGDIPNGQGKWGDIKGGTPVLYGQHTYDRQPLLFICEGELDCLALHSLVVDKGLEKHICVSSVPCGAGSFGWVEQSVDFLSVFHQIVIIPDNDKTGRKMLDKASEKLAMYNIHWIDLAPYTEDGGDVSDCIIRGDTAFLNASKQVPIDGIVSLDNVNPKRVPHGFASGFLTHDNNDNGLKPRRVTLLTGFRGHGKTTVARQMLMCAVKQGHPCFAFFGESSEQEEMCKFAKLSARDGEIEKSTSPFGRVDNYPSNKLMERFKEEYGSMINLYVKSREELEKMGTKVFDDIMAKMKRVVLSNRVKLIMLDSMMMMVQGKGSEVFQEQARIICELKEFAKNYRR